MDDNRLKNLRPFPPRGQRKASPTERDLQIALAVIHQLPERHRAALRDYYYHGLSAEQAAETGQMGVAAFRELTRNVRARVNAAIARPVQPDGGPLDVARPLRNLFKPSAI